MRVAYVNLVDTADSVTPLTNDLLFPIENTQNQRLSKRWRSTARTAQTVVVDLGSAKDVDTLAILGHSLSSSVALTVEAHTSDSWGAPDFTTSLSFNTGAILKYLAAAETFRYWRYTLDDASASNAYVEVGRLWLGERITIDPSSLLGFTVTKRRSDTVVTGRDRQKYSTEGVGWRAFQFSFPRTKVTMLNTIQTLYDTVGLHSSFIFSNFDTARDYTIVDPVYVSFTGDVAFNHTRSQKYQYSLSFEEDR